MSSDHLTKFPINFGEPLVGPPAGWTVLNGEPVAEAWRVYTSGDGRKLSGLWRCSMGGFRVSYDKWEFCHMLTGQCVITPDGGDPVTLRSGDSFVLDKGFTGTWDVIEPMEKHFVFVAEA